jgi:6,7-dimethyl-8-ribityllumazine synthase
VDGTDLFIAIVASRYNEQYVEPLLQKVRETLQKNRVAESSIRVLRVPGAAEIPYAAQMLALTNEYDAIIALGLILKGDTDHASTLATTTAYALQGVALQNEIPVINGILSVNNVEQAEERVNGPADRGTEFANTALEMAWHRVRLSDYLDTLDAEAECEGREAAGRLGPDEADDDNDDFRFNN